MRTLDHRSSDYAEQIAKLNRRAAPPAGVGEVVAEVIAAVSERGDQAVIEFTEKFDGATLTPNTLRVTEKEFTTAQAAVDEETLAILKSAHQNVSDFAKRGLRESWSGTNAQGAEVGERYDPFTRVGIYVPGGSAPLVSTVLMTVTLAQTAEVPEIVVCTPCGADGQIHPALLVALQMAGATEVYKIGGSQAIAAMALGTETVAATEKIFGPGNSYVVEAKRQVFGTVAIDLLPGPSEVMVLADQSGRADYIAADLLAQAEHGGDSQILFATDSEELLAAVESAITTQAASLSRQAQLLAVLEAGAILVVVPDMKAGVDLANAYAPEHLTLISENTDQLIGDVRTSGAIFVGNDSPVAVGDFLAGPSHTLPTGGAGKSFAGLTVDQFQRRTSIVRLSQEAAKASAPIVSKFAQLEGLDAHARSAEIRATSQLDG